MTDEGFVCGEVVIRTDRPGQWVYQKTVNALTAVRDLHDPGQQAVVSFGSLKKTYPTFAGYFEVGMIWVGKKAVPCRYCSSVVLRNRMWRHTQGKRCLAHQRHHDMQRRGWKPVWKFNRTLLVKHSIPYEFVLTAGRDPEGVIQGVGVVAERVRLWCPGWVADMTYESIDAWWETFAGSRRFKFMSRGNMIKALERRLANGR